MYRLTRDELIAMDPCGLERRLAMFGKRKTLNAKQAFAAGASIRDLLWVAQRLGHERQCVEFALACAQRVAYLDKSGTAQPCIDATRLFVDQPTEANRQAMFRVRRNAADAADSASASAYAAATAAAYAAAYAADAAAYAAVAVAECEKEIAAQKALFVSIFK